MKTSSPNVTIAGFALLLLPLASAMAQSSTTTWTQPSTNSPGIRVAYPLSTDTARDRVVLFGGVENSHTWEWDGSNWLLMSPANAPSWRHGPALAFDAQAGLHVMFGGSRYANLLDQTWTWDGTNWTQLAPSNAPSARVSPMLVYDSLRSECILFGGYDGTQWLNDTWRWNGSNWQQLSPAHQPTVQHSVAGTFDAGHGVTMIFGAGAGQDETWTWDGVDWSQHTTTTQPSARNNAGMAYHPPSGRVWLYGGEIGSTFLGETWSWNGADWTLENLAAAPCDAPPYAGAFDPVNQAMLVFIGHPWSACGTWLLQPATATVLATGTVYGQGCGNPSLTLQPGNAPRIGTIATATIGNAPTPFAGVSMGWSNSAMFPLTLPFDLSSIGMTGCDLLQSNDVFGLTATPSGANALSFSYAIPFHANLIGGHVYLQAYCYAPGSNALDIIASNGLDWRIGDY